MYISSIGEIDGILWGSHRLGDLPYCGNLTVIYTIINTFPQTVNVTIMDKVGYG